MKLTKYNRWHRYDMNNKKYITQTSIDSHPEPMSQEGYTTWKRGTGPHTPQALVNVIAGIRKACLGIPKKESTKQKMRLAKLGKPKTEAHKESMRLSHKLRRGDKLNGSNNNNIQVYK